MASGSLMTAFFAQTVIVTYRSYAGSGVKGGGINVPAQAPIGLPLPSTYTAPVIAYGALALLPPAAQPVAGMIGWGLVVATLLNLWDTAGNVVSGAPQAKGGDYTRTQDPNFMGPLPSK